MRKVWKIGRRLFGVAVLSALGVGATQAFASPPPADVERACCIPCCRAACQEGGYRTGQCVGGYCECLW